LGTDGKPVQGVTVRSSDLGAPGDVSEVFTFPGSKGRVMYYVAISYGSIGTTTVYVPDGKEIPVTIRLKPDVSFIESEQKAQKGKASGDGVMQQEGYDEAKQAAAGEEQRATEMQAALDAWAKENDIPTMTAAEAGKQIKASEALGENQDGMNVGKLRVYRSMR